MYTHEGCAGSNHEHMHEEFRILKTDYFSGLSIPSIRISVNK